MITNIHAKNAHSCCKYLLSSYFRGTSCFLASVLSRDLKLPGIINHGRLFEKCRDLRIFTCAFNQSKNDTKYVAISDPCQAVLPCHLHGTLPSRIEKRRACKLFTKSNSKSGWLTHFAHQLESRVSFWYRRESCPWGGWAGPLDYVDRAILFCKNVCYKNRCKGAAQ